MLNKLLQTTLTLVNVVLYLVMVALWISIPDEFWLNFYLSAFNFSLTLLLVYVARKEISIYVKSSVFKSFVAASFGAFLLFCILGLINYMAFKSPRAWDFTYAGLNSLTDQTRNVLDSIDGQIEVKIFATQGKAAPIQGLVELYRLEKSDFSIEVIDPELRPDEVQRYNVTSPQTIVLSLADKSEQVLEPNELNITNALLRLTRTSHPQVCFVTGHSEVNLDKKGDEGYTYLKDLLEKSSYEVKKILTVGLEKIPSDCRSVVLMGPKQGLRPNEIQMLDDFVRSGGGLIVGLTPNFNEDPHQSLREMLKGHGVEIRNDLVMDTKNHVSGSQGTVPLVQQFPQTHPIVKTFEGIVFFPLSSSLHEAESELELKYDPLIRTSTAPQSWAESSVEQIVSGNAVFDQKKDTPGPITLAAALTPRPGQNHGRLVVYGNATLLMNAYANYGKNYNLFLNSLSWVSNEDQLISFDTPQIEDEPVFISSPQLGIIFYFSVVFGPLLLLGAAFLVYRRRRLL